jgi:mannan endo-1,4-beta-mannosidase
MKFKDIYFLLYISCVAVVFVILIENLINIGILNIGDKVDNIPIIEELQEIKEAETEKFPTSKLSLNPAGRIGLGVYLEDSYKTKFQSVLDFEDKIDKKLEYIHFFSAWGDADRDFPDFYFDYIKSLKLTPIITWEPWKRDFDNPNIIQPEYSLASINTGAHDEYIKEWAKKAKEQDSPIILRFAHEMTTPTGTQIWYPWQGDPENYKLAFQRVVSIFRENSVNNVTFMWNPLAYDGSGSVEPYYPGDEYVDYIGFTIINLGDSVSKVGFKYTWQSCSTLLAKQLEGTKDKNKPIIVAELLSSEKGGNKSEWYLECLDLLGKTPLIVGVVSSQVEEDTTWTTQPIDWRVDSTPASLEAFITQVKKSSFK